MTKYIIRRILQMIPVIIGATFLIFAMVFALPGDPTEGKCGERPCSPAYIEKFRAEHNLNDPLVVQYGKYMGKLVQGDLGTNFYNIPVAEDLSSRYVITAKLAAIAIAFEIVISIPSFVIGSTLQYLLGVRLRWFPVTAANDPTLYDLVLPGFVLGSLSIAYVARLMRTNLVENLRADYVRTAISKGLTRQRAVGLHAMRNSMIPVVTFLGADFGGLLGGAIITERIFNINGVGGYIFTGIRNRDGIAVVSAVTMLVFVFLLVNLLIDLLYGLLDPRISHD